ncbi:mitochondrial ribosomal death-associated protein 3-domain-containing protein [Phaeosphaeriaceae sp. PMI808]|nr:mitochondrial ribosomal death-associated protein 3-domain-containing protein [Phaeosphaeriaceae sp. PMI808]
MSPSICLRSFSQLSIDVAIHPRTAPRLLHHQVAFFSTSTARYANPSPKRKGMVAAPKKGVKSLNTKKGKHAPSGDAGKRPAQGERKALRKRIVLSNNNALEVSSLKDLNKENVLSIQNEGKIMGLPEPTVDALRAVDAFKTSQGWSLFRRPAVLMRKEAIQLATLFREVEESAAGQKKTIRRILSGERMSGKTTLLLQGLSMAFLREWFVINLPEAQDIVNAHTDYTPLPDSQPIQYTQDTYTAALLQQILKSNLPFLETTALSSKPNLPLPLPANATLKDLVLLGSANPEVSWPVFVALWSELSQPGRPLIMLAIDGLSHVMRDSKYLSADIKLVHAHDLTLIRHFVDHLSGQKSLPNGGIVLAATSQSNAPTSPALDFRIEVAKIQQKTSDPVPQWNPYKKVDARVMEALKEFNSNNKDFDVINVGGLTKNEARAIMEYYAESGLLRHQISESFVSEKWSLAGMGNIGELERTSVRLRI